MSALGWFIIVVLILLVVYPRMMFVHDFCHECEKSHVDEIKFNTGDILMYVGEHPIYWKGSNGTNFRFRFDKHLTNAIQYYWSGHYTHAGIVVVLDGKPYVWELTSHPMYDYYTGSYVYSTPSLQPISNINLYEGCVFLHKYQGNVNVDLNKLLDEKYEKNIKLQGNWIITLAKNGLGFGKNPDNNYMCVDFVEEILTDMGIIKKPTRNANISSMTKLFKTHPMYDENPVLLINTHYTDIYTY